MQPSADRFAAQSQSGFKGQQVSQRLARPTGTEVSKVPRSVLGDPPQYRQHPARGETLRSLLFQNRSDSYFCEQFQRGRNPVEAAEEHGFHVQPGQAIVSEQDNVCPPGDARVGSRAIGLQKHLASLGGELDTAIHGLAPRKGLCENFPNRKPSLFCSYAS